MYKCNRKRILQLKEGKTFLGGKDSLVEITIRKLSQPGPKFQRAHSPPTPPHGFSLRHKITAKPPEAEKKK